MELMNFEQIKSIFGRYVIPNYPRNEVAFVRGEGSCVWDSEGNRYVDLMPGWGTTTVGHCHPRVVAALQRQAAELIHVDNTFYNVPQGELARLISERSFGGQCFLCNSGTEAVETAIKLARLHGEPRGRYKTITMLDSFHGRTFAAISATGQAKYHKGYLPLLPGFTHVPFGDLDAVAGAADAETCAVMLEPIQGEGGVNMVGQGYMQGLRRVCDEKGLLLIVDEVQTGMGRTGKWFGYQHSGIEPDIMTLAKALGGGVAVGGIVARKQVAESLKPGTHASTFGGNPLACAAAVATFQAIEEENMLEACRRSSEYIFTRLRALEEELSIIEEVRGRGMMIGIELDRPGTAAFKYCLKNFVRINCTHETVLRMLPSLNIPRNVLDEGLAVVEDALRKAQAGEI
ncbi:MAG: aspartate aminotransferase family protein [Candidatus Brocadiia bacterium]|jgi:acetylornithine/N-succinyldiaminopimelate aminotransferase|nr:aspartate aminotransferase family protein [Candidatus Brocadiia bacterium]